MTLLDLMLLGVMLVSALLAMVRGFTREVLSIASWGAAGLVALMFYKPLAPMVRPHVGNEYVALGVAAAALFITTLIIVSYVTARISDFILDSQAGALDRTLGFVFGAGRGFLLMTVAFLLFSWFGPEEKRQPSWVADAKSKSLLSTSAQTLLSLLPDDPEKDIMGRTKTPAKEADKGTGQATPASPTAPTTYERSDRRELNTLIEQKANTPQR